MTGPMSFHHPQKPFTQFFYAYRAWKDELLSPSQASQEWSLLSRKLHFLEASTEVQVREPSLGFDRFHPAQSTPPLPCKYQLVSGGELLLEEAHILPLPASNLGDTQ